MRCFAPIWPKDRPTPAVVEVPGKGYQVRVTTRHGKHLDTEEASYGGPVMPTRDGAVLAHNKLMACLARAVAAQDRGAPEETRER